MAQTEVMKLLKENGEMTIGELAEIMKISSKAVRHNLIALSKTTEVEKRILTKKETGERNKRWTGRNQIWRIKNE